jgi:hypothetical protein
MKAISKKDQARLQELRLELERADAAIRDSVLRYNDTLEELTGWLADRNAEITEWYDQRSERWQDGEAGQQYAEWAEAFDPDALESIEPEGLDANATVLDYLPLDGPQ